MCHIYNLVVDLLQEAPYFFEVRVKAESDFRMNRADKKRAMWGNPLKSFGCLLQLVELIPCPPNKLNIKKSSVEEPLGKFWLLSSVAPPFMDCRRRPIASKSKEGRLVGGFLAKFQLFP